MAAVHGAGRRAIAKALVVAEVALSLVLLAGAGLLMRSVAQFAAAPLTSQAGRLITMKISLPGKAYANDDRKIRFYTNLTDSLRALPDFRQAVLSTGIPVWGGQGLNVLEVQGHSPPAPGASPYDTGVMSVSMDYFAVAGPALERGRPFDSRDREDSERVAIVNDALVAKYFLHENPLGRHIRVRDEKAANPWLTVVGVVANQKTATVYQEMAWVERPALYRPFRQEPSAHANLLINTNQPAARVGAIVQRETARLDPSVAVDDVQTMQHLLDRFILAYPRFRTALLGGFAAIALLLAAVGLYGVLAQLVSQRTQEIAVRIALGARSSDVLAAIVKEGMLLVFAGLVLGLGGVWLLTRFLAALLYGVRAMDPLILIGVCGVLTAASLLATYIPARRAASVDPMVALRYE